MSKVLSEEDGDTIWNDDDLPIDIKEAADGGLADSATPKAHSSQVDALSAKKYSNGRGGTYYGNPEITGILATFESRVMHLHGSRDYYKPGSRAYAKQWDDARLTAAQSILDLVRQARVTDLLASDRKLHHHHADATNSTPSKSGEKG